MHFWTLTYTVVFDTGTQSSNGTYPPDRRVHLEQAGAFRLDSLHDISILPASGTQLPTLFEGQRLDVVGNGFSSNTLASDCQSRLIKAKAAGLDLDTVLASYPPPPHYRFATMLQKAKELAGEVKSLGAALLAALEKKDAEDLALMRSRHEIAMMTLVRDTRQR